MNTRAADAESGRWFLKPALIAAAGVLAVAVAIALNYMQPETPAPGEGAGAGVGARSTATRSASPAGSGSDATAPAPIRAPSAAQLAQPLPAFDVVRINPRGDTVIAGRAEPGATVALHDGDRLLGQVTADGRGEWVFVPDTPLPPGSHRLELEMHAGRADSVRSADEVIVVVPMPGEDIAGRRTDGTAQPLALRQPRGGGPAVVMQAPGSKEEVAALAVDAADAGAEAIVLTGRAPPGSKVRVSIDARKAGDVVADDQGRWTVRADRKLAGSDPAVTVELLDGKGMAVARAGVPLLLAAAGGAAPSDGQIVVQRGENLWRIARSTYGSGTSYTIIYEANRGRIADPDLIYPGQVFRLPPDRTGLAGN